MCGNSFAAFNGTISINMPENSLDDGKIDACITCSSQCGFGCCNQAKPGESDFGPESSLLLYPGELDDVDPELRAHILITQEAYNGGQLGYCDRENFDQASCDPSRNYKPLDCHSYPFAPTFVDGELALVVDDRRCPLPARILDAHYRATLAKWAAVLETNPSVRTWVEALNLKGYSPYSYAKN